MGPRLRGDDGERGERRASGSDGYFGIEVTPIRIAAFDQCDLPGSVPMLQLLLSSDGSFHAGQEFVVNQHLDTMLLGESVMDSLAMLPDPLYESAGDADIERAVVATGEDVDARLHRMIMRAVRRVVSIAWNSVSDRHSTLRRHPRAGEDPCSGVLWSVLVELGEVCGRQRRGPKLRQLSHSFVIRQLGRRTMNFYHALDDVYGPAILVVSLRF
jgi:hypothetical protein